MNLKMTETQKRAWKLLNNKLTKNLVLCQSRQSGKSVFLQFVAIYRMCQSPKANIGYVAPFFSHCRKAYSDIIRILQPSGLIKSANAQTLQIELITGARMSFFSAESPNALRGNTFSLVLADECSYISDTTSDGQDFWNSVLSPTGKARKAQFIYASTPREKGSFFHKMYIKGLEDKTYKTRTIHADIYADSLLTEEEIKEIKDSIPELSFRMEYMCEFMDNAMSAFTDYTDKFTLKKQIDFNQPLWIGVDFHSVGSDSTVVSLINADNDVWQIEIKGGLDAQYRQIANILDKCKKLIIAYMESNSIGSTMTNEIFKLTRQKSKIIEWTTTNESKEIQVGLVQTHLTKDMMHFEESNKKLKNQFDTFTYSISKTRKITYAALSGHHDDNVLSLMIAMQAKEDYAYSGGSNIVFIKGGVSRMSMR